MKAPEHPPRFFQLQRGLHAVVDTGRLEQQLYLAFQLEGLSVGVIQIRPHHLGLVEVEIDGKGPFILSPTVLAASNPEAGYVSEDLRAWIDEAYLKASRHDLT